MNAAYTSGTSANEIRTQWRNPGDIFSLLLLVGSDVVQQSVARLTGVQCRIPGTDTRLYITPAAFSFGWVGFAFLTLGSVFGDGRLMPKPDPGVQVIDCRNGYTRDNNSWLIGRLLRDHEEAAERADRPDNPPVQSTGRVSLLIDIYTAGRSPSPNGPRPGLVWWLSWIAILFQLVLSIIPWILWADWSIFLITGCGTLLALSTASLPQWSKERWSANRLRDGVKEIYAITRGNGRRYVMILLAEGGAWDVGSLSSGRPARRTETSPVLLTTVVLWILMLLTVTGLKEHAWFLVGAGGIGTLQNIVVAALPARDDEYDLALSPFKSRPRITGYQMTYDEKQHRNRPGGEWESYNADNAKDEFSRRLPEGDVRDVMGALMELEKYPECRKAGAALLHVFFPDLSSYSSSAFYTQREREYWSYAASAKRK